MIDDELELTRLHDWQVRGLRPFEETTGVDSRLTPRIRNVGSVAHQPAGFDKLALRNCSGELVNRRQLNAFVTPGHEEGIAAGDDDAGPLAQASVRPTSELPA